LIEDDYVITNDTKDVIAGMFMKIPEDALFDTPTGVSNMKFTGSLRRSIELLGKPLLVTILMVEDKNSNEWRAIARADFKNDAILFSQFDINSFVLCWNNGVSKIEGVLTVFFADIAETVILNPAFQPCRLRFQEGKFQVSEYLSAKNVANTKIPKFMQNQEY
jgi:hypothetical protein